MEMAPNAFVWARIPRADGTAPLNPLPALETAEALAALGAARVGTMVHDWPTLAFSAVHAVTEPADLGNAILGFLQSAHTLSLDATHYEAFDDAPHTIAFKEITRAKRSARGNLLAPEQHVSLFAREGWSGDISQTMRRTLRAEVEAVAAKHGMTPDEFCAAVYAARATNYRKRTEQQKELVNYGSEVRVYRGELSAFPVYMERAMRDRQVRAEVYRGFTAGMLATPAQSNPFETVFYDAMRFAPPPKYVPQPLAARVSDFTGEDAPPARDSFLGLHGFYMQPLKPADSPNFDPALIDHERVTWAGGESAAIGEACRVRGRRDEPGYTAERITGLPHEWGGEADWRVAARARRLLLDAAKDERPGSEKPVILVASRDTDILARLIVEYERVLFALNASGVLPERLPQLLFTFCRSAGERMQVCNVGRLYDGICHTEMFGGAKAPAHMFLLFSLASGSDYTSTPAGVGLGRMWSAVKLTHSVFGDMIRVRHAPEMPSRVVVNEARLATFIRMCAAADFASAQRRLAADAVREAEAEADAAEAEGSDEAMEEQTGFDRKLSGQKKPPAKRSKPAPKVAMALEIIDIFSKIKPGNQKMAKKASLLMQKYLPPIPDWPDEVLNAAARRAAIATQYFTDAQHPLLCGDDILGHSDGVSYYGWHREDGKVVESQRVVPLSDLLERHMLRDSGDE